MVAQLVVGQEPQALLARRVGIVPLEPGPAAAECAVGIQLDAAHAQPVAIHPGGRRAAADRFERRPAEA